MYDPLYRAVYDDQGRDENKRGLHNSRYVVDFPVPVAMVGIGWHRRRTYCVVADYRREEIDKCVKTFRQQRDGKYQESGDKFSERHESDHDDSEHRDAAGFVQCKLLVRWRSCFRVMRSLQPGRAFILFGCAWHHGELYMKTTLPT